MTVCEQLDKIVLETDDDRVTLYAPSGLLPDVYRVTAGDKVAVDFFATANTAVKILELDVIERANERQQSEAIQNNYLVQ